MKFSVLLFFTYLYYSEAKLGRAQLVKVYRWNDPTVDTIPNKSFADQVNLNVKVWIGNDVKPYNMTVSTRSLDSWLVSTNCTSRFCKFSHKKIDTPTGKNISYIENFQVQGKFMETNISIAGHFIASDFITNYQLYAAVDVSYSIGKRLASKHTNGILSLNRQFVNAGPQGIVSLMTSGGEQNMGLYNGIPRSVLEDINSINQQKTAIMLTHSSNKWTSRIYYIRNTRGEWHTWCVGGCTAVFDTTYNGISGPADDINSINAFIGADGNGMIDCDSAMTLEPLSFVIRGHEYTLDAKYYILKSQDKFETQCQSAFKINDSDDSGDNQWRLGLPFFDQYLTTIEYDVCSDKDDGICAKAVNFLRLKKRLPNQKKQKK